MAEVDHKPSIEQTQLPLPQESSTSPVSSPVRVRKRTNDEIYQTSPKSASITRPLIRHHSTISSDMRETREMAQDNNSTNAMPTSTPATFVENIDSYRRQLDDKYESYTTSLADNENRDLSDLDWRDLQNRYTAEVQSTIEAEQELMREFTARSQQCALWMQASCLRDNERALKRLRTKVAFVQHSEDELAARQEHYAKVVAAFQQALALFGAP